VNPRAGSVSQQVWRWIGRGLVAAACIALLAVSIRPIALFIEHGELAIRFPYTLNYGEGPLLDQTMRLTRGDPLYPHDLTQPPHTITNYPPLYIMAQAPFAAQHGAAFWYGRAISFGATIAAALCLALLVLTLTRDLVGAMAAGLAFIAVPYIFAWSALTRIDALALACSIAGLALIVRWHDRTWGVLGGIALLTAAVYTRQTYALAAPLAAACWLLTRGGWMRALSFGVGLGSVVLAIFAAALVGTRGGFFTHLITANVNALDPALIAFYVDEAVRHLPILIAGGGLALGIALIGARPAAWLGAAYTLGALVSAATIAKVGSDVNYLWELSAALCLMWGIGIAGLRRAPLLRAGALAALAVQVSWAVDLSASKYHPLLTERIVKRDQIAAIASFLDTHDLPVIADEAMGEVVLSGRSIAFQPFEFSQLARDGIWDETPFLEALARGDHPLVMIYQPYRNPSLRFERWTPAMLRIINDRFRPLIQHGETTIYQHIGS
jgi:hypothetical protein